MAAMPLDTFPVSYFPVPTQRQFERNSRLIRGKPYEHYFSGDMNLRRDVLPALRSSMQRADALAPKDVNALLDPGYHSVENGFCELADGSAYVASRVPFPGASGEMYAWWFWWHSVEPARYTLWYPYNHIAARPVNTDVLTKPGLTHEERYVGNTHHVDEYIGSERLRIAIRFLDPAELGFDTARFAEAGIVGHACARVSLRGLPLEAVTMVHLARATPDGIEQRSRYWIGHDPKLKLFGSTFSVDRIGAALGTKKRMAGARVAHEQLLHDQIEFTHLATFLPELWREFGRDAPGAQRS
jgi:2,4-diacetylphloroglucinol hydrolase